MTAHSIYVRRAGWILPGVFFLVFHPGRAGGDEVGWQQDMNAGAKYKEEGKYSEAEKAYLGAFKEAEHFPEKDPRLSMTLNNLGFLYYDQGRYGEAEPLYIRALNLREQFLGPEHPEVASTLNNLAELYCTQGYYAKAEPKIGRAHV